MPPVMPWFLLWFCHSLYPLWPSPVFLSLSLWFLHHSALSWRVSCWMLSLLSLLLPWFSVSSVWSHILGLVHVMFPDVVYSDLVSVSPDPLSPLMSGVCPFGSWSGPCLHVSIVVSCTVLSSGSALCGICPMYSVSPAVPCLICFRTYVFAFPFGPLYPSPMFILCAERAHFMGVGGGTVKSCPSCLPDHPVSILIWC